MKSKKKRPYLGFLKEYAFKKKLLPYYILTIAIIVLTAGVYPCGICLFFYFKGKPGSGNCSGTHCEEEQKEYGSGYDRRY